MKRSAARRLVPAFALALCGSGAGAGAPAKAPEAPPHAILMFVASWCAPCHGEIRSLPLISKAAGPMRVFVVPIDRRRGTDRMLASVPTHQLMRLEPSAALALMQRASGGAAGLPTTVATDAVGKSCGIVRRPLLPDDLAVLRRRCGASS